jgi:hypothetical protein
MATFVATVPYANIEFANDYFAEVVDKDAWLEADQAKRDAALAQATRTINTLNFIGRKTDPEQVNEFPRNDDDEVPQEVSIACCEVALAILRGLDLEAIHGNAGKSSEKVGDASVSYSGDGALKLLSENSNLPSTTAMRLLNEWLVDPRELDLERIS